MLDNRKLDSLLYAAKTAVKTAVAPSKIGLQADGLEALMLNVTQLGKMLSDTFAQSIGLAPIAKATAPVPAVAPATPAMAKQPSAAPGPASAAPSPG